MLVAGGAEARSFIVRYVQLELQGPDAYTAEELAYLNTRRVSKAVFAPYD